MINEIFYLGVIGSRSFTDYDLFKSKLSQIIKKLQEKYSKVMLVSGGARGADSFARKYAKDKANKVEIIEFLADWDRYPNSAGFIRNKDIVNKSDMLVAFWDGKSKGTFHSMKLMNIKKQNRLMIIRFTPIVIEPPKQDDNSIQGINDL
jgi:hypothetical protein